jgi:hypothetical protein
MRLFFMAAPSVTVVVTAVLAWTAEGAAAPFQPVSSTGAGTSPGGNTKGGTFLPGHDARLRGKLMRKEIRGTAAQRSWFKKAHG